MLTKKQIEGIGNGSYHISEGAGAPELAIKPPIKEKESKMSEPKMVTIPAARDLEFKTDQASDAKLVFFTEKAVDMAVDAYLINGQEAAQLKEVLSRPGEVAAYIEVRLTERLQLIYWLEVSH